MNTIIKYWSYFLNVWLYWHIIYFPEYPVTALPPIVVTTLDEVIVTPVFSNITGKIHPKYYTVEYRVSISE